MTLGWPEAGLDPGEMIGTELAQAVGGVEQFMVVDDLVMLPAEQDQVSGGVPAASTGRTATGGGFLFADNMGDLAK